MRGEPIALPSKTADKQAGKCEEHVLQVFGMGQRKGLALEGSFFIVTAAAEPAKWHLDLVEHPAVRATGASERHVPIGTEQDEQFGRIPAGEEFVLEVVAKDRWVN